MSETRMHQIEQELRGTIHMQDDLICKLVQLNNRLKAALAISDYDGECRYCQHRGDESSEDRCWEVAGDCCLCSNPCHCGRCRNGSMWALDMDKLPGLRTILHDQDSTPADGERARVDGGTQSP